MSTMISVLYKDRDDLHVVLFFVVFDKVLLMF